MKSACIYGTKSFMGVHGSTHTTKTMTSFTEYGKCAGFCL